MPAAETKMNQDFDAECVLFVMCAFNIEMLLHLMTLCFPSWNMSFLNSDGNINAGMLRNVKTVKTVQVGQVSDPD